MSINQIPNLELARVYFFKELSAVLNQLQMLQTTYPQTFQHICSEAINTGEMSLGDAESALGWAMDYLQSPMGRGGETVSLLAPESSFPPAYSGHKKHT